ncbi:unnamed protein product [Clonostachys solani]|uniref:NADH-cytochrome b5 reductase n=1 Tax=Clonostachys solani TaxID=160281 RepID=A0A9N9Z1Q9_9HYPO|nr:unnamed protein product [Clonostachys solani]
MSLFYPLLYSVLFAFYWINHRISRPQLPNIPLRPGQGSTLKNLATSTRAITTKPEHPVLSKNDFKNFPLVSRESISRNVSIFRFGLPRPTDVLGLPPGQHIALAFDDGGKTLSRSYTPMSTDHDRGHFDVLVKLYPEGKMSCFLDKMKIGDEIRVRGPKGAMTYKAGYCDRIGMIAGGSGITPMLQIIKAARMWRGRHHADRPDFANTTEEDIILKKAIDRIAEDDQGINVHYVLSQPPKMWAGSSGRVNLDMIKAKLPPPAPRTKIMLCGPPAMVTSMTAILASLNYERARPASKKDDQVFCF